MDTKTAQTDLPVEEPVLGEEDATPIDEFHWHEALDRASLTADIVERALAEHPVIKGDPEFTRLVNTAVDALCTLYQAIAVRPESMGDSDSPNVGGEAPAASSDLK